jgi:tetratricopeptide (TPR) repeat protein
MFDHAVHNAQGVRRMLAKYRVFGFLTALMFLCAGGAWAQVAAIEGDVHGQDGQAIKDAKILIERKDMKGTYKGAKTDKKGHYIYNGLPLGTYKVSVEIDGKTADFLDNVRTRLGDPTVVNFDLKKTAEQQQQMAKAVETGTLTKEQERSISKEQKEALEKRAKENAAALAKNKALNDAFNVGREAMLAKNWDAAVDSLSKAVEMDANQNVIWGNLADAYVGQASTKTGAEKQAALDKSFEAFNKAIQLKPDDPAYHNNYALALAQGKKFPEAEAELNKAAQLDPTDAAKYYYNLGALLVNTGQLEPAGEAFKKALDANPNYADAQYQYGIYLMSKATTTADGKIVPPPGTKEAFEKYLELAPNGPNADAAKGMLTTMGATLQTTYSNPNAPKKAATKKK